MTCTIGLVTGQIYRSDIFNLKNYRVSVRFERFCARFILPLIGTTRAPRYSNRALPNDFVPSAAYRRDQTTSAASPEDLDGSAAADAATAAATDAGGNAATTARRQPSAMSEWVDELTGRRGGQGLRVPTDEEISTLTGMFPGLPREQVVSALQRRYARIGVE